MDATSEQLSSPARNGMKLPVGMIPEASPPFPEAGLNPIAAAVGRPRPTHPSGQVILTDQEIRDLERQNLIRALEVCDWRIQGARGAAELLGVRPSTLRDRMRAFQVKRPA